jgi:hypothetical protein
MTSWRIQFYLALGLLFAIARADPPEENRQVSKPNTGASIASTGLPPQDYLGEAKRTRPDFLVFLPAPHGQPRWDEPGFCGLNEQLIVRQTAEDELRAFWTSWGPKLRWLRILTARSGDGGKTWSEPATIDGADVDEGRSACWGVPVVTPSGRLYLFYNKRIEKADRGHGWSGALSCRVSDDGGDTWSDRAFLPFRRTRLDNPDPEVPPTWIAWKGAVRGPKGRVLIAFTRWASPKSEVPNANVGITSVYCQCELMRIENLDEDPDPGDVAITWLPREGGIRVPNEVNPKASFAQEPAVVPLPDGRLFLTTRTNRGELWYTVSEDGGATWRPTEPLRYYDDGPAVRHPVSPAPVFPLDEGRYLLLFNNNDGYVFGARSRWTVKNRRPAFLSLGQFREDAHQPIWWSAPREFIDNDGVPMGNLKRLDAAAYPSLTRLDGRWVLWYPDRKHFLLGKFVPAEWLEEMAPLQPPKPVNTPYAREVKRDEPTAYWCFQDPLPTEGALAADQTGDHHGTYRGGVRHVPGVPGIGGNAAAFDGRAGHVSTTTLGTFGRDLDSGAALEFWVKTETDELKLQPIGLLNPDGTAFLVDFNRAASLDGERGKTNFFLRAAGGKKCLSGETTTNIYDGKWHHVVWVVRDPAANRAEVYIDGRRDEAYTPAREHGPARFGPFTVPFVIGAINNRGRVTGHTAATFDEVAVYPHPLAPERIAAHYAAAKAPSPTGE